MERSPSENTMGVHKLLFPAKAVSLIVCKVDGNEIEEKLLFEKQRFGISVTPSGITNAPVKPHST